MVQHHPNKIPNTALTTYSEDDELDRYPTKLAMTLSMPMPANEYCLVDLRHDTCVMIARIRHWQQRNVKVRLAVKRSTDVSAAS